MQTECIDGERIAEVIDLPTHHPLRRHVADCPRCRNLLRSYQKFVLAEPVAGFASDAALRTLDALIASKVGGGSVPRQSTSRFSLRGFLRPVPLLAAGAMCILVAVVVWRQSQGPDDILLRSEPTPSSAALAPAEVRPDGSILLSWTPVPGADAYQVRLYGPGFTEIYRHPDVAVTSVVIERSALPSDLPPTLDLLWRVYALQAGDVIETSDPGSIRTR